MDKQKYLFGEVVFDITTCSLAHYIDQIADDIDTGGFDSRELYANIYNWAEEFEREYPDPGDEYMILVEEFAYRKLNEYFGVEGSND